MQQFAEDERRQEAGDRFACREGKDVGPMRMCVRRQAAHAAARVCRVIWHISDLDVIYVNNLTYIYIYVMSKFYRNNLIFF